MRPRSIHLHEDPLELGTPPPQPGPSLEAVAEFLRHSRRDVFSDWPQEILVKYLRFHRSQRAVAVALDGDRVVGVAIGWRGQREGLADPWHEWDEEGPCLYFAQFHAATPAAVLALLFQLQRRVPRWRSLELHASRRGRPCRIPSRRLDRLFQRSRVAVQYLHSSRSPHGH